MQQLIKPVSTKASLSFWFSKSKIAGFGTIKLAIVIDKQESQFSTGIKLKREEWQGNTFRVSGNSVRLREAKQTIGDIEDRAIEICKIFRLKQQTPTSVQIRQVLAYLQKIDQLDTELTLRCFDEAFKNDTNSFKEPSLVDIMDWFETVNPVRGSTKVGYSTRKSNLLKYLQGLKQPKMKAKDFGITHAEAFFNSLFLENGLSKNYAIRQVYHIRNIFKVAVKSGKMQINPLEHFEKKRQLKRDLRHLTPTQLEKFQQLSFVDFTSPEKEVLEKVKDIFLFMCWTGLHIGDYFSLKQEEIQVINGSVWMIRLRNKTGQEHLSTIYQKMHPSAVEIINKYGGRTEAVFQGKRKLKKQVAGLPYVQENTVNKKLKVIEQMIDINMGLSTKIGRKTFAWMCLNIWRYDLETTAKMMGCEVDNIEQYAEVERERIDAVVNW